MDREDDKSLQGDLTAYGGWNQPNAALPKESPAFQASPLLLGARAPSPANRGYYCLEQKGKFYSRYALNAGEGARVPSVDEPYPQEDSLFGQRPQMPAKRRALIRS